MAKKTKKRQQKRSQSAAPRRQVPTSASDIGTVSTPGVDQRLTATTPGLTFGGIASTSLPDSSAGTNAKEPSSAVSTAPSVQTVQSAPKQGMTVRTGKLPNNAAALIEPLSPEDAAIPLDRVPFVPSDLRRVAFMAVLMIIVIIIAGIITVHLTTTA